MRRKLLLLLSVMTTVVSMAADVTPQQALQEAQRFVQERAKVSGRRVAATPQLTLVSRVSDLYVFNAADNGGFVIVSNDDCTEAVLGYSDTGAFDPNNIPDNMRGWLQGYADEIAWAKTHNIQKAAGSAPRRTSTVKTAIAPLIQTQWNQGAPYNNLCPYYGISGNTYVYSKNYIENYEHCVTGCVATAMAQVMYYNKWPTSATTAIPSYNWGKANVTLDELTATTFKWADMQTTYPATGTEEEIAAANTAIATLMQYCGYSVEMDYGASSGAVTSMAANALRNYFDYATTTSSENRSYYSYANWIELLYNELNQGRVVLYHGNSTGGGHAFVCDGYQTEDYFHINWGWGGLSDGHFKLSAMDPDAQGIGGSSSTEGFNYLQGAIVGIQKNGATGTVLDLKQTTYSLQFNSVTLSPSTVTVGESVNVTFNVTNNGSTAYDGDIYVYLYNMGVKAGKTFLIAAGETKDCTISYTPTGFTGTISVFPGYPSGAGGSYNYDSSKYAVLTVNSGSGGSTTDNIDLTVELTTLKNSNAEKTELYSTDLDAVITITNPSTTENYNGTFYLYTYGGGYKRSQWGGISIPAGKSYEWTYSLSNLNMGDSYHFAFSQQKNATFTDEANVGSTFTLYAGIITYNADGTTTAQKATETFTAPDGALAVDVSTGSSVVTTVTPNSEPNAVYIYSGSIPSGLDGKIVVEKSGSTYTAGEITLTDGSGFYSPVDFTATSVEFTFENDRWADGTNGWNTIMLPFDVTSVTANGTEINWFRSDEDTGKQFWLKEFTSDGANTVDFDHTDAMKANTPYIIALPGDQWGSKWDLSGKTIKFIGENTIVHKGGTLSTVTGSNYRFIGNTVQDNTENIYTINAEGNSFVLNETGGCAPFRAFFKPGTFDRSVTSLGIGSGTNTTGLNEVRVQKEDVRGEYFDLQGRKVTNPTKGLYIVNGKKVIVK